MTTETDSLINCSNLLLEMDWLENVIRSRLLLTSKLDLSKKIRSMASETQAAEKKYTIPLPPELANGGVFESFIRQYNFSGEDRLLLALALAPHLKPELLNNTLGEKCRVENLLPEVGGTRGVLFRGFIPTGITWLFLAAGRDFSLRFRLLNSISPSHTLVREKVILFHGAEPGEPLLSGAISISDFYLNQLLRGEEIPATQS